MRLGRFEAQEVERHPFDNVLIEWQIVTTTTGHQ
jgi:hypothetical protein